ncbi:hypothetical protein PENSUB_5724 [Penicillium subrubescens]|uniref:Uncharacterized protein n=1 Tax=Penicillium subrubescens TaxID=1316194 RepID=A0A1Q5U797_9EURO|nr:hypothetical protein PENSUB_5724 [Penicillium subrubescens]
MLDYCTEFADFKPDQLIANITIRVVFRQYLKRLSTASLRHKPPGTFWHAPGDAGAQL